MLDLFGWMASVLLAAVVNGASVAMALHLWFAGSIFTRPRTFAETMRDLPDPDAGPASRRLLAVRFVGELVTCPLCVGFHLNWMAMLLLANVWPWVVCPPVPPDSSLSFLVLFWLTLLSEVVSVFVYRKLDRFDDPRPV